MPESYLITGGQRSGKSLHAEQLALSLSENPLYLATSVPADDDFRERVRKHQERRGPNWTTIEEPIHLSLHADQMSNRVVLVDCITLWLTNIFFSTDAGMNVDKSFEIARKEIDALLDLPVSFIFVTNEIGLGGVSMDATQRHFTDLQGLVNQYIASKVCHVTLLVSGIPVKVK